MKNSSTLPTRCLCLFLALLMGCSSGRSQYIWHDLGPSTGYGASKGPAMLDKWGIEPPSQNSPNPVVAPGYLITLSSLTDRKLNGDFRIDFDGNLVLPYDVTINTNNPTLSELKKKLLELYQPYFKGVPDINIHVKERTYWVDVRGLVQKPGRYLLQPNDSLDQVLAQAGGVSKENPPKFVRIQKGRDTFAMDLNQYYNQGEDPILGWVGGEVIFFQKDAGTFAESEFSRKPLSIMGEVHNPGEYALKPGADIVDVITQAGGFTSEADLDRIEVIRRSGGRKRVFDFSWKEFERAPAPAAGDVVFVHADKQAKIDRRIAIIGLIVTIITSGALVYEIQRQNDLNNR